MFFEGSDSMYVKLTTTLQAPIDSVSLYAELEDYDLNVTDVISKIYVYGEVNIFDLDNVLIILLKYGADQISITK